MEVLIQILTAILIFSAALLCFALIYYLSKIVKSVRSVEKNIQELSAELKPLMQSTQEISDNLIKVTSNVKEQVGMVNSVVSDFRDRADKVLNLEYKIRSGFEDAVMPFVQNLNAIGKGFETFWRSFTNK